jgi:hypothetical protein
VDLIALFFLYYLVGIVVFQLVQTSFKSVSSEALFVGLTISVAGMLGLLILIFSGTLASDTAYRFVIGGVIALMSGDIAAISLLRARTPQKASK